MAWTPLAHTRKNFESASAGRRAQFGRAISTALRKLSRAATEKTLLARDTTKPLRVKTQKQETATRGRAGGEVVTRSAPGCMLRGVRAEISWGLFDFPGSSIF